MSTDLSQFYEVFFEESFEGLDVMESELLVLQPGSVDSETINTIFRAAHSIKGGSGTFGFDAVADFTHVVETFLDQIRSGERCLEVAHVDLLLKSVDCVRTQLTALQQQEPVPKDHAKLLAEAFESLLNEESQTSEAVNAEEASNEAASTCSNNDADNTDSTRSEQGAVPGSVWGISFIPEAHLFRTGNEPLYMLQELQQLGKLDVDIDFSHLPVLEDLAFDDCLLAWKLTLTTTEDEAAIREVFEWVEDDCRLDIKPMSGEQDTRMTEQGVAISRETTEPTTIESNTPAVTPTPIQAPQDIATPKKSSLEKDTPEITSPTPRKTESSSIRVSIDKVDSLINMVGELVITQAMLQQLSEGELSDSNLMRLREGLTQLAHNTRDLQESVMQIRMLPISFVFSRFPRLVRDITSKLGKKAELKMQGETTELDKTVMEKISDPIVHLIRNSLDHGLETPEERVAAGKPETGEVLLNAFHQGGSIVIEISDDGKGLNAEKILNKARERGLVGSDEQLTDAEIHELIFKPGFSTADSVSDISGRGVGMDVVRRNIQELNGSVEVQSTPNAGSTFTIRLPLTLAILDGQLVTVGSHTYIIPLVSIIESILIDESQVSLVAGDIEILRQRDEYIPIIRLSQLFNIDSSVKALRDGLLVIVDSDSGKIGILVDDLLSQQQVVIKSLEANFQRVEGISGATILGDGTVSLIVDVGGLIKLAGLKKYQLQQISGGLEPVKEAM